jgi:hypothetical protein
MFNAGVCVLAVFFFFALDQLCVKVCVWQVLVCTLTFVFSVFTIE